MKLGTKETTGPLDMPAFAKIQWNVDETLAADLFQAKEDAWSVLENCELNYVTYSDYGADWVKQIGELTHPGTFEASELISTKPRQAQMPSCR